MSTLLNVVIICLYIKVACIAWQRQRQRPVISNEMMQKAHIKSQSKTTKSLLMVLGIFTSTYTIWLITYYCTVDKYTDTIELIQTLTEWLWQVCTNHLEVGLLMSDLVFSTHLSCLNWLGCLSTLHIETEVKKGNALSSYTFLFSFSDKYNDKSHHLCIQEQSL